MCWAVKKTEHKKKICVIFEDAVLYHTEIAQNKFGTFNASARIEQKIPAVALHSQKRHKIFAVVDLLHLYKVRPSKKNLCHF